MSIRKSQAILKWFNSIGSQVQHFAYNRKNGGEILQNRLLLCGFSIFNMLTGSRPEKNQVSQNMVSYSEPS